jgi:hypothetical protein
MNKSSPESEKKIENIESTLTKELVINSLKQNPEDRAQLHAYIDVRQKQIQAPYVSREDTEKKAFEFAVELAEIYRDVGLREAAWDAYNDAADMAQANGMDEDYQKLLVEMGKV